MDPCVHWEFKVLKNKGIQALKPKNLDENGFYRIEVVN